MKRSLVVLILLASLLAGCTGDGDDVDPTGGGSGGGDDPEAEGNETQQAIAAGEIPAPWDVGHYWSYRTSFGTDFTLVVSEDQGDDWFLDTPDEDTAWFHVREPISYLGEVRKDDLAGSQGSDRVQYFDFPLEEGNEWTTQWDGVERRVVTVEANETFRFEAYEEDQLAVEYDYDPEIGWFTKVTFYEGEEGEESFSFEINEYETGWSGDVMRWNGENHVDWELGGQSLLTFGVEDGTQELWTRLWGRCDIDTAVFSFHLAPAVPNPSQEIITSVGGCMDEEEIFVFSDPDPGEWMVDGMTLATDPEEPSQPAGHLEVEIWSRNLETLTVG